MKRNIRLAVAYDGTQYQGWQRQTEAPTLQGVLEDRIRRMVQEPVTLIGSGRTDAGVHALRQVCNFATQSALPAAVLRRGLNALLPEDIRILEADEVPLSFHSRFDARSKTYEYRILNGDTPDVFLRRYVWHVGRPLERIEMQSCLAQLRGKHDFSAFRSSGSGNTNPVREVFRAELQGDGTPLLKLVIEADGFLRHMVRNIVGTLVEVGFGRMHAVRFGEILFSKDRRLAGMKAPARGLFLTDIRYEEPKVSQQNPWAPG